MEVVRMNVRNEVPKYAFKTRNTEKVIPNVQIHMNPRRPNLTKEAVLGELVICHLKTVI